MADALHAQSPIRRVALLRHPPRNRERFPRDEFYLSPCLRFLRLFAAILTSFAFDMSFTALQF
jgi:hypothetical protein